MTDTRDIADNRRAEQLRIQALGAAISRRDWHAAEIAHAAIRDEFDCRAPTHLSKEVERLREQLGQSRMCLNCGKVVDARKIKRGDELPECVGLEGLSGCTFNLTPEEAWQHWRNVAHDRREELRTATDRAEAAEARVKELEEERAALSKALDKANERVGGIEVPAMNGDNLAVTLCSHFDDGEDDGDDDSGWGLAALKGCDQTLEAVRRHYNTALSALSHKEG